VRDDVSKSYPLRLPEPLYLQLKWVAAQRGMSVNALCKQAIADAISPDLP
jgi:predicted HicB family RNase H-like nuclease